MKRIILLTIAAALSWGTMQAQLSDYDMNAPIGWGAMPGHEVTGGAGGDEVVVTTEAEFDEAINVKNATTKERDVPRIIYVKGEVEFTTMHTYHVKNKTILGLPDAKIFSRDRTKKNSGILKFSSGSGAASENIIIRNLTIQGAGAYDVDGDDALLFQGVERVWVDHCDIQDGVDSSFDCNHESDYLCITWCRFRYLIPPLAGGKETDDHRFCNTWGASDSDTSSEGHLNTTFANCWWGEGVMERAPRVRFGKVHVLNCYYTNTGNHYSLGYGYKSNIYADRCWFANGVTVAKDYTQPKKGYSEYNLQIVDCHNSADIKQGVGDIPYFVPGDYYDYSGYDTALVPAVVGDTNTGAGATLMVEVGKGVTGYAHGIGPTGIDSTVTRERTVCGTTYYTPSGTRLLHPQKGVTIVRETMDDGTVRTRKVM